MIVLDSFPQGSPEWIQARLGIASASNFERVFTPGGQPSKQARSYLLSLVAERISGQPDRTFQGNRHTERGKELEPEARAYYALQTDDDVREVGFVYQDERRLVGCSPDGLVGANGGLEIKCLANFTHCGLLVSGESPEKEYKPQIQGNLLVTGREWWDWLSYTDLPNIPPILVRVYRDEPYLRDLSIALQCFTDDMLRALDKLAERGIVPATAPTVEIEEEEVFEL